MMISNELRKIKNLITAGNISVIISIFIAGVPLDVIALVCALVARSKFKRLVSTGNLSQEDLLFYNRKSSSILILSSLMLLLNLASLYFMPPYMLDYFNQQMGQFLGNQGASSIPNNGSNWY